VLLLGLLGAAPWLYAEFGMSRHGDTVGATPVVPVTGRWVDDYFVVQQLDADTYAIGEPRYYQGNYSYLLLGRARAVLFDGGPGLRDIVPVVRALTGLRVTVIASHLHYDHVGALGHLDRTAMLDLPELRDRVRDGGLQLGRYEFLGFLDHLRAPRVRVDEWWRPGSRVDLGGREIEVIHAPGHTPTSLVVHDRQRRQLFAGDFIYPSTLYGFLPGASRSAYLATTRRLRQSISDDTSIYTAHLGDTRSGISAPRATAADLDSLRDTLQRIEDGQAAAAGTFPRRYKVRGDIEFATGYLWNNR
jgi:glyoxylase-like metal-dependent hydrolase (beta-lactamase superfamily II)